MRSKLCYYLVCLGIGVITSITSMTAQQAAFDSVFAISTDNPTELYPLAGRNLVFDPATSTLQIVFESIENNVPRLYWATSTDKGKVWTKSSALDNGTGAVNSATEIDLRAGLATAADRTPYAAWVESRYATKRAVFFTRDEGYNLGLWRPPLLLNDTTAATIGNVNIAVTQSGDTVLVAWVGGDDIWFTRSVNGGTSFDTAKVVLSKTDPALPNLGTKFVATPSLGVGSGGYAFLLASYPIADTVTFGGAAWGTGPVYVKSSNYGATWSSPTIVPQPPGFNPPGGFAVGHNHQGGSYNGGVTIVNNLPHFPWVWKQIAADGVSADDQSARVFEGHLDGSGNVTWTQISRDSDPCFSTWTQGGFSTISSDAQGRIFVLYQDLYNPGFWIVSIRASTDGGVTWSNRMPLIALNDKIWTPEIANVVGDTVHWIGVKGGAWTFVPTTAIVHGAVAVNNILSYVPPPPSPDTTDKKGYSYEDSDYPGGPSFKWIEISTKGTKIANSEWLDANNPANPKDDGSAGPIQIGFDFPFFGKVRQSVYVGANGALSFAGHNNFYIGVPFPGAPINDLVAVFWHDLYLDSAYTSPSIWGHGSVYHWQNAAKDTFIVQWHRVQSYSGVNDSTLTFQVIFSKADSAITFQYLDVGIGGVEKGAIVGIQPDSLAGLKYVNGCPLENIVHGGLAVRITRSGLVSVSDPGGLPEMFQLAQNYPNPFNPSTTIEYSLPVRSFITLKVFNILGQEVKALVTLEQEAGRHTIVWDGSNSAGEQQASGLYFCRLNVLSATRFSGNSQSSENVQVRKMLLLR